MASSKLCVWLNDREIGTLVPTRRGASFAYGESVVSEMSGRPVLSLSLPVKRRAYAEGLTGAWFRGLLPEGERLTSICRTIGCEEHDYFSILERIGWECAGAVSIRAKDSPPPAQKGPTPLSENDLAQKLRDLPTYGGIDPLARVSLGGFQEKLLVKADDLLIEDGKVAQAKWQEPGATTISTHILKPQPKTRYPGIIEGEAWAMTCASAAARCAHIGLLHLAGAPLTLVVERYDRVRTHGLQVRIHQEDCCQAMGLEPSQKYAGVDTIRGNDPTYAKIAGLLDRYAENPEEERRELLRQLVVNLALGNVDAHAKNYALLYKESAVPAVAPMYDVVPVADDVAQATFLSMRVDGVIRFEDVRREHVIGEATHWGLSSTSAVGIVDETLERLREGLVVARGLFPQAAERHEARALRRLTQLTRPPHEVRELPTRTRVVARQVKKAGR